MAQFNESTNLATENGNQVTGALVPREHDLNGYMSVGAPMVAPVWPEQSPGGMSVTKMLHSFRRRWMLALFMGLLLGIPAALATWLIFPKQYEVEAMLQFSNIETFLGDDRPVNPEAKKLWRESQLFLIRSPHMLTRTLSETKVANLTLIRNEDEPIYFLQKSIGVFSPKDSNLVVIRMTGEDSREMVEIVRTLTDKYIAHATAEASTQRNKRIDMLQREYDKNDSQLRTKWDNAVSLMETMGAADSEEVSTKKAFLASQLQSFQNQLTAERQRLSTAFDDVDRLQSQQLALDSGQYPEALLDDDIRDDPRMRELQMKIGEVVELLDVQRSVAKYPQHDPAVLRTLARYKNLLETEDQLKSNLRETARLRLKHGDKDETLEVAQRRAQRVQSMVDELNGEINTLRTDLLGLSQDSAELKGLQNQIEQLTQANATLNQKLVDANLGNNMPPPVDVLQPADEPEGSTLMYRVILTSFLGLLCFCVGVGGVVLLEYTKQRVSTLNDIGYGGLGIRVLGTVPNLARLSRQVEAKNGEANSTVSGILAESIDSVRTMLLSNKRADAPRVILVTSADEHEGKTTVASHLAASLARAGRRTLLVDGDLRKPTIHTLFDMPLSAGVCEVLRGEAEVEAVVHPAQVEGMWVMLAGQCDQQAIASLAKESAEALFRTLRADYEFVVIDTGPALAFADTMLMGGHADAAVMAILRDVSQIPKVYEARERLEAIGVPVLGGVVGGVSTNGSRNYALMN